MSTISTKAAAAVTALNNYGSAIKAKKDALAKSSLIGQPNGIASLSGGLLPLAQTDPTIRAGLAGPVGDSGYTNYDVPLFVNGKPGAGDVLAQFIAIRQMVFPTGAIASRAACGTPPSGTVHVDVYINAFLAGTITFSTDSTVGDISWPQNTVVPIGSLVKLVVRETIQDSTFADVSITIRAEAVSSAPLVTQAFKLIVSGYSAQLNSFPRSDLSYQGVSAGPSVTSYDVVTLDPTTGQFTGRQSFDVYDNAANADAMATYLNSIPTGTPFVVYSADEPQTNHLAGSLAYTMMAKGATSFVFGGAMVHRAAYALLCVNDGILSGSEFYAGLVSDSAQSAFTLRWDWIRGRRFDANSYGVIDNSAANLNFGSSDFTIEAWITPDQAAIAAAGTPIVAEWTQNGNFIAYGEWVFGLMAGVPTFWYGPVSGNKWLTSVAGSLKAGKRYHLAMTRSGTTYTMYVNGIAVASGTNTSFGTTADTTNITIGDYYKTPGVIGATGMTRFTGIMDVIKITKACRYTGNFAPQAILPTGTADSFWANVIVDVDMSATSGSGELTGKTLTWVGTTQAARFGNVRCDTV